jgi:hypothetical protein
VHAQITLIPKTHFFNFYKNERVILGQDILSHLCQPSVWEMASLEDLRLFGQKAINNQRVWKNTAAITNKHRGLESHVDFSHPLSPYKKRVSLCEITHMLRALVSHPKASLAKYMPPKVRLMAWHFSPGVLWWE